MRIARTLTVALLAALSLLACAPERVARPDPRFVESHSGGVLSRGDSIRVVFVEGRTVKIGERLAASPIRLSPAAAGAASWIDDRTLEFKPDAPLRPATVYRATVDPGLMGDQGRGSSFQFEFAVLSRDFDVETGSMVMSAAELPDLMELHGKVRTNDSEEAAAVEGLLAPRQEGRLLETTWIHEADGRVHDFTVKGIRKLAKASKLELSWSGKNLRSSVAGSTRFAVPAKDSFEVLGFRAVEDGETYAELSFTEELAKRQDFRGLVQVVGMEDAKFVVDRNLLKIYSPSSRWPDKPEIKVSPGLKSESGTTLVQFRSGTVAFDYELPAVRFAGPGVILPTSQGITIPVETRNLNGLIVEVFRIHGNAVTQFLQVNNMDQGKELYRVGKVVKRIELPLPFAKEDRNVWKRTGIDLSDLVKEYPDGMFQVRLMFARRHVEYECKAVHPDFSNLNFPDPAVKDGPDSDQSYWDYAEDYYDGSSDNYYNSYQYRKDPCHPAFYRHYGDHDIIASRNLLVSDIGIMAKAGIDGSLHIFTTDLKTAAPLPGVSVELEDFQRQAIATGTTDSSGMLTMKPPSTGSFIVAEARGQRGFLKLAEGLALSVSQFDVSGDKPREGLKGFIYGERGVWRPGDDIWLTFLLYDEERRLPAGYPVVLELQNPRGQLVSRVSYTASTRGFYPMRVATKPEDPTGDWLATVRAGGAVFTKSLKVENIMPNRLKATLSYGNAKYLSLDPVKLRLEAKWLTGIPAPGLKADVTATFAPTTTSFPGFTDYTFEDPTKTLVTERQILWQGNLDESSKAVFDVTLEPGENAPGKLRANLQSRVFEPSGVFSSESFAVDFHPYDRYVGLKTEKGDPARGMLLTDIDHPVQLALLDRDGKPLSGQVQVELYQVKWRWWWEKGDENFADFTTSQSARLVSSGSVRVTEGRGTWNLRVNYPNWGRYFLVAKSESGHTAGKIIYIDWPGWAGRAADENPGGAQMLTLETPKQKYLIGEKIALTFPSNDKSIALVVVEAGGKPIRKQWIRCQPDTTKYEIAATAEMTPNVYFHVSLLQPHLQTANDLPIRLYGIQNVAVEDPSTRLYPLVKVKDSLAPASEVQFEVSEADGRPMTYSVAVVDEGLLGLTRFSVPNPWETFYRREASMLRSWDLFQYVAGAWAGKLENLLAVGGGDDGFGGGNRKTNRFPPVVTYLGPFNLAKGARNAHSFTLPQYVGAVRFMVVAASGLSKDDATGSAAFGSFEKEVTVKSDLMVLGTLPRVLSPGERVSFPVTVYSYVDGKSRADLTVSAKGPVSILAESSKKVDFDAPGDKTVNFTIQVGDAIGPASFSIEAASATTSARQNIDIDVRPLGQPIYKVVSKQVTAGGSLDQSVDLPGLPGTNSVSLEVSRIPPIDLGRRLDWLIVYPHGCIEQTTSSVFPQLFLDKAVALSAGRSAEIDRNIKAGIELLKGFQTPRGGFAYWPGGAEANEWGSNYAGHFLLLAKNRGYEVQPEMLAAWQGYQKNRALAWGSGEDLTSKQAGAPGSAELVQAYRLYTLALAGAPDIGAMNRLREHASMPATAKWRLAAAYWLAGQRGAATDMVTGLSLEVPGYRELDGTFGSGARDEAMILEALTLIDPESPRIEGLMKRVTSRLNGEGYLSTQEIAYSLIALLPYALTGPTTKTATYTYGYADSPQTGRLDVPFAQHSLEARAGKTAKLRFVNTSSESLWLRVVAKGTPAAEEEKSFDHGVSLTIGYQRDDGTWVKPEQIAEGSDFFAIIEVSNKTYDRVPNLALTFKVPGSWEIANDRVGLDAPADGGLAATPQTKAKTKSSAGFDYVDIRDDRLLAYFGLDRGATKTMKVRLTRTYGGIFYLPSSSVEAMYDAGIQSVQAGRWLGR